MTLKTTQKPVAGLRQTHLTRRMIDAARAFQRMLARTRGAAVATYTWSVEDLRIRGDVNWQKIRSENGSLLPHRARLKDPAGEKTVRNAALLAIEAGFTTGELHVARECALWIGSDQTAPAAAPRIEVLLAGPGAAASLFCYDDPPRKPGELRRLLTSAGRALRRGERVLVGGPAVESAHARAAAARVLGRTRRRNPFQRWTSPGFNCAIERTPARQPDAAILVEIGTEVREILNPIAVASLESGAGATGAVKRLQNAR